MGSYGAETWKPTMLLSNSPALAPFLRKARKAGKKKERTCRRYRDKEGRPRFSGTRKLKQSQKLGCNQLKLFTLLLVFRSICICMPFFVLPPRVYTAKFARSVVELFPKLYQKIPPMSLVPCLKCKCCRLYVNEVQLVAYNHDNPWCAFGQEVDERMPLVELSSTMEWTTWEEANLAPVLRYTRFGSQFQGVPEEWATFDSNVFGKLLNT